MCRGQHPAGRNKRPGAEVIPADVNGGHPGVGAGHRRVAPNDAPTGDPLLMDLAARGLLWRPCGDELGDAGPAVVGRGSMQSWKQGGKKCKCNPPVLARIRTLDVEETPSRHFDITQRTQLEFGAEQHVHTLVGAD